MSPTFLQFLFLFFKGYAAPRDLHSFPSRRSSDLLAGSLERQEFGQPVCVVRAECLPRTDNADRLRSEQHTSELQSRENLVCRLLLEKKKKKKLRTISVLTTRQKILVLNLNRHLKR